MREKRKKMKENRQRIMKKYPRIRDIRNITLLSIAAIITAQAITNADLIKVMATNWMFGIQKIVTPQTSLNI